MIVDGQDGWIYNISSAAFTQITDADFPSNVDSVTQQDGYFIVGDPNTQNFFISALNDGLTWSALDFETAEFESDNIVTVKSFRDKLYVFGSKTTEPYFNSGNADFPFNRINDAVLQVGCSAKFSVASNQSSLFWLAQDGGGENIVVRVRNFESQIISTRAISYQISTYDTIDDAFGYVYSLEGEEFYVLSFPSANVTWAYNTRTGLWHQWQSLTRSAQGRHISNNHMFVYGKNLVGDWDSGNIYELSTTTYTDNGTTITRVITTAPVHFNNENLSIYNMRIDIESGQGLLSGQGSDPQMMLQVSYNGGHTFGDEIWRSAGATGEYFRRVHWSRLGMSRSPVFKVTMTDPIKWIILGAFADIESDDREI
jgi:hypothetical protein